MHIVRVGNFHTKTLPLTAKRCRITTEVELPCPGHRRVGTRSPLIFDLLFTHRMSAARNPGGMTRIRNTFIILVLSPIAGLKSVVPARSNRCSCGQCAEVWHKVHSADINNPENVHCGQMFVVQIIGTLLACDFEIICLLLFAPEPTIIGSTCKLRRCCLSASLSVARSSHPRG